MSKTLAIIGARLNSSRLPGKHLLPLPANREGDNLPMIGHLLKRLQKCQCINLIELATTNDDFNRPLIRWADANQLLCEPFDGDVNDLMGRLDSVIQRHQPDYIVYICGDCPLVDPEFIDHALSALQQSDCDTIALKPNIESIHEGMAFYSLNGWQKLLAASQTDMTREHVGYADKLTPVLDKLLINDSADYSSVQHRISVDTPADFHFMEEIYRRWYSHHAPASTVELAWVVSELRNDAWLRQLNAHVTQKSPEKKYSKVSLYCHCSQQVGLGHLKRSAMLAESLQEHLGVGTSLIVQGNPLELSWLSTSVTWHHTESDWLSALTEDTNSVIILDLHPDFADMESIQQLCAQKKTAGTQFVALDKLSSLLPWVELLFVPSFYTELDDPKVSAGWQNYFIQSKRGTDKQDLILILTGGSDALGYGEKLPDELHQVCDPDWQYIWVQGPAAKDPKIPKRSIIERHVNPDNLPELIASAKIVMTCYGLTLFEAMAQGAAVILLPTADICSESEKQALACYDAVMISTTLQESCHMLQRLQHDPMEITKLANQSSQLLRHSNGLTRLTKAIEALLKQ
ncbi:cytidylyltransferase domain-containing protein [Shewanella sp. GXUN23E]|uniref:cytidylyltransferase domain-containing protein n=1 Tax=Shewanella sp. GXUN23E TaxID=3422498 RepID=UPI003D7C8660